MASIFTFDPDPPRVSSPWATPPLSQSTVSLMPWLEPKPSDPSPRLNGTQRSIAKGFESTTLDYSSITRLEAEPQDGPTEYKLHLLLRRRRSFTRMSTVRHISGSICKTDIPIPLSAVHSISGSSPQSITLPPLATVQSKQHRLQQLTTQLLWRLQQSCSYHVSSTLAPVLPYLPDDAKLSAPETPQRLLPGLEESKGALYEIGIADDGTIVGLAEDEMEESLNNLRAMAASLGCGVEVVRMVPVGECEWTEHTSTSQPKLHISKLMVAEAFVRPAQHLVEHNKRVQQNADATASLTDTQALDITPMDEPQSQIEQLRVSVTGATMSGKSSLLGTLSTATLDNGRGKSRLSLLRHRHEIASGMTSSVTQELIGYRDINEHDSPNGTQVISYGSGDISSWIDIHAAVETSDGRLVCFSDSAGHPRFRRTTVRGIMGWQPHWTLLCVPADNTADSSGETGASPSSQELLGPAAVNVDLSEAHIQLCLNLELPLVIVITKYDLATLAGLRLIVRKLLSAVKEAGRQPRIVSDPAASIPEAELHTITKGDINETEAIIQSLETSPLAVVPIILTSAVKGSGIQKLHSFLRKLPLPTRPMSPSPTSPSHLFHIEDVYSLRSSISSDLTAVIGGHLCSGNIAIGNELLLGPYPVDLSLDDSDSGSGSAVRRRPLAISRSFPGAVHTRTNSFQHDRHSEWRRVRVVSLRNLCLPVRTLFAGQIGTIGIVAVDASIVSLSIDRIRKGMVLAAKDPKARSVVHVRFEGTQARAAQNLSIGSAVVAYIASVRASSKVISITAEHVTSTSAAHGVIEESDDGGFGFSFDDDSDDTHHSLDGQRPTTIVGFQFIASREFVEVGAQALIMPGGGPGLLTSGERGAKGLAGLEGFVGNIIEEDDKVVPC